jgi:hypothetical protein
MLDCTKLSEVIHTLIDITTTAISGGIMSSAELAWIDQDHRRIADHIRRYGVSIQAIGGDQCQYCPDNNSAETGRLFAYTVGMFGIGHPEFLMFPRDYEECSFALNAVAHRVRADGEQFLPGQLVEFNGWPHRAFLEEVPNPGEIVFSANHFYQRPAEASVPVLQLTLDDQRGRFPWEPGCSRATREQPRPGEFRARD